jgi:hypothetical protein
MEDTGNSYGIFNKENFLEGGSLEDWEIEG